MVTLKLKKYVKNKKVIATVISLLIVFITTTIKTYANENKEIENNNSIKIEKVIQLL